MGEWGTIWMKWQIEEIHLEVLAAFFLCVAVLLLAMLGGIVFGSTSNSSQTELWCYSGGHLVLYDVCDEAVVGNGYINCVTAEGNRITSTADCIEVPVGYE